MVILIYFIEEELASVGNGNFDILYFTHTPLHCGIIRSEVIFGTSTFDFSTFFYSTAEQKVDTKTDIYDINVTCCICTKRTNA